MERCCGFESRSAHQYDLSMYTVTLDLPRNLVSIDAKTLESVRSVGSAAIEKIAFVTGYVDRNYHYKNGALLKSGPEFLKMEAHELAVGPAIIWKDLEEFVSHAIRLHAQKLAKSNLLPLTQDVVYYIVEQDRSRRQVNLSYLNTALETRGVLKGTV